MISTSPIQEEVFAMLSWMAALLETGGVVVPLSLCVDSGAVTSEATERWHGTDRMESGYAFSMCTRELERRDPMAVPGGNLTDPF